MKKILHVLLFCLAVVSARAISKEIVLQTAYGYVSHSWTASADNIWLPEFCGGKTVETPQWVGIGTNTSVPYCWGGYVSVSEFDAGIEGKKSAGDRNTSSSYGAPDCATGVDCSGFVSQAWGVARYTTSSLSAISEQLSSYRDLEEADVVNKSGSHVRMIYEVNPNGSITMVEAATGNALVGGDGLYRVFNWTYSATDLQAMQGEGYVPRRYEGFSGNGDLENQTCGQAMVLQSHVEKNTVHATVSGANASDMEIPNCSGYASPSALDVWFSFRAVSSEHVVTVEPLGDLDAVVALYSSCSATDLIDCIDVSGGPGLVTSLSATGLQSGETYYVRVFDYGSAGSQPENGEFYIYVQHQEPRIANDDCSNAQEIDAYNVSTSNVADYVVYSDVVGASESGVAIPNCSGYTSSGASDVWFSFIAVSAEQTIRIDPTGIGSGALDAVVALYKGTCNNLDFLECIDVSGGGGLVTELTYDAFDQGKQYYVRVFDYGTVAPTDGRFAIDVYYRSSVAGCSDKNEPNNTSQMATAVDVGTEQSAIVGCIADGQDVDVYKLSVPKNTAQLAIEPGSVFADFEYALSMSGSETDYFDGETVSDIDSNQELYLTVKTSGNTGGAYLVRIHAIADPDSVREVYGGKAVLLSNAEGAQYKAVPSDGFVFIGWQQDGTIVERQEEITLPSQQISTINPVFEREENTYHVQIVNTGCAAISGGGYYKKGTEAEIRATVEDSCAFEGFQNGSRVVSTSTDYRFIPNGNVVLVALYSSVFVVRDTEPDFVLYPNPAKDVIHVIPPESSASNCWSITDLQGNVLLSGEYLGQVMDISVRELPDGAYLFVPGELLAPIVFVIK